MPYNSENTSPNISRPVILCILDGFGYREDQTDNAIKLATTPVYDRLWQSSPKAWLKTSGLAVGLPEGQMGNSEVGHMSLGSGRVVLQDLPKINQEVETGNMATNEALLEFARTVKSATGRVHLLGLLSPGGVHSHQNHMLALAKILTGKGLTVAVHAFLDGRDTPPRSAAAYVSEFEAGLPAGATIATVSGRFWAMDRDKRWDRVEKAWTALTHADAATALNASEAIKTAYAADVTDEFIEPTALDGYSGIEDGDGLLMANFRADRAREILEAFVDPAFEGFPRPDSPTFSATLGMVDYSAHLSGLMPALYPSEEITESLGEIVSQAGLKQLRISETEKYAHVTFFFNGGSENTFEGEDRILIPSPNVATYDLKPEMSAHEVTDSLVDAIHSGKYGVIIVNYANPDMVGHTGVLAAAIKAVETIDACLDRLEQATNAAGGVMLVTADHGNVELMRDQTTGAPHTAHTDFDVPLLLVGDKSADLELKDGSLSDVAPTILGLLGLDQPDSMTGTSLIPHTARAVHTP